MSTNLLNLDELATVTKTIKLDSVDHPMKELTVQEFVDRAKAAAEVSAKIADTAGEEDIQAKVKAIVGMIHDAFPTITMERLGKLTLPQLNAILEFSFATPAQIEADARAASEKAPGNG